MALSIGDTYGNQQAMAASSNFAHRKIGAHPELVAQPRPSIARRASAAVVSAAAGSVAKALTDRAALKIVPAP